MSKKKTTPARAKRANRRQPRVDWDLAAEQRKCEQTARRLLAFLSSDIPDFLFGAVADALRAAAQKTGVTVWRDDLRGGDFDPRGLAALMAVTGGLFTLQRTPAEEFAHHLAGALAVAKSERGLVPVEVFNHLAEASNELLNDGLDYDGEEVLRLALEGHARNREHEAYAEEARRLLAGKGGDS